MALTLLDINLRKLLKKMEEKTGEKLPYEQRGF